MRRAALLLVLVAGCASDEPDSRPAVRFGLVVDLTGSLAHPQWRDAAELAVGHANEGLDRAGAGDELRFEIELADSLNESAIAAERARDLFARGNEALVVDTSSNAVEIQRTVYDTRRDNDIAAPVLCIACTSPDLGDPAATVPNRTEEATLRNGERWGFRTSTSSEAEAVLLLQIARSLGDRGDTNRDATNKIALEIVDDLEGNGFFRSIERSRETVYPNLTVERVRHDAEIAVDAHDWNGDLISLTNDRNEEFGAVDGASDAIIEFTYPLYAAALSRAYEESEAETPFLHHHNWRHDQTLIKLSTFSIEGHEGVSHAIVDNCDTSGATFWRAMEARTGREPSLFDSQAYDAVMLLALGTIAAMEAHGVSARDVTRAQLRDALHTVGAIDASDPRHDPDTEAARVRVEAGPDGFARAVEAIRGGMPVDYVGASGPVDFDENGNVRGNFVRYRVDGGRFVDVETYDCVTDPACPASTGGCGL